MTTREELPAAVYTEVTKLSESGSDAFHRNDFATALSFYNRAWALLPEPRNKWDAGLWLTASQADCFYFLARYGEARARLQEALTVYEAIGNTFVHLRLGQVEFELGNLDSAADHLMRAFLLGGHELLQKEHPRYIEFLRTRAPIDNS